MVADAQAPASAAEFQKAMETVKNTYPNATPTEAFALVEKMMQMQVQGFTAKQNTAQVTEGVASLSNVVHRIINVFGGVVISFLVAVCIVAWLVFGSAHLEIPGVKPEYVRMGGGTTAFSLIVWGIGIYRKKKKATKEVN